MKKIILGVAVAVAVSMSTAAFADSDWSGNYAGGSMNTDMRTFGAHLGRNYDLGVVVLGAEAGVGHDFSTGIAVGTIEGIVGADLGNVMPYVSGGWTHTGDQVYGVGMNYRYDSSITLGGKWSNTDGTQSAALRVSFSF